MKFCSNCGTQIPDEAMFCTNCGTPYNANTEEEGTTVLQDDFDDSTTVLNPNDNFGGENYYNSPKQYPQNPPQYQQNQPQYQQPIQQPVQQNQYAYQNAVKQMTKEQFFERFASKKTKSWYKTIAIICLITAIVSLGLLGMGNYVSTIDVIFYLVFGILQLKKKNWVFPLVVTCYGGLFTIVGIVTTGTPSGIFACVAGVLATIGAKKVNDAYEIYIRSGQIPANEI